MDKVQVQNVGENGKGLFAKHLLSTRDIIHVVSEPAMAAISTSELGNFCYGCCAGSTLSDQNRYSIGQFRDSHLQICTGCQVARFCGRACQTQAWKRYHKYECKMFAKLRAKGILPEPVRAVLRLILQHDNCLLEDGLWSRILSLESHLDDLEKSDDDWTMLMLMAKACQEYSRTSLDLATVLKLLCILKVNAMVLATTYGDDIGVFLDPFLSRMNHSCDGGNVFVYRPVHTNSTGWSQNPPMSRPFVKLLPLREIAKDEELTITYVDCTESVNKRRLALAKQYMFHCICGKCQVDQKAREDMQRSNPDLIKQLDTWSDTVDQQKAALQRSHMTQQDVSRVQTSLMGVVSAMEQHPNFSADREPYPQAIHELKLSCINSPTACDQALIYALHQFVITAPIMCTSPLDPRRIVQAIFVLQLMAVLAETYDPDTSPSPDRLAGRRAIEERGFSQLSFVYWRLKICVDTRKALSQGTTDDLVEILMMEQLAIGNFSDSGGDLEEILESGQLRSNAEEEMRSLLDITQDSWKKAMERLNT